MTASSTAARCLLVVIGVSASLAFPGSAGAAPFKVGVVARQPAPDADAKTKKDQEEAPKSVPDILKQLQAHKARFTVVEPADSADFVIEVIARHQPGFGPKTITFRLAMGTAPLDAHAIKLPGAWTELAKNLVDAVDEWASKSERDIRDAVGTPPRPLSDEDRAKMNNSFKDVLKQHSWWLSGVDAK